MTNKRILITGVTGKVGKAFLRRFLAEEAYQDFAVRAFVHSRVPEAHERVEIVRGSISDPASVHQALSGVTHVLHLATCKETQLEVMDVAVKGLFWLLEGCRVSPTFQQFLLVGGDAALGHFFYPHPLPVTEQQKHSAYPGCYALSKVLEETMLEQYSLQYDLNGCCLRAPWIMEKDDFKVQLSFGEDVFGGPRWKDLVGPERAAEYQRTGTVTIMLDPQGRPVKRNFIHVDDLVEALLRAIDNPAARKQTFNIAMDEPVDYGEIARYLEATRNLPAVGVSTPYHSTWLDNTKAKFLLDWRPRVDLNLLIDRAWDYQRSEDDPRKVWYPG